MQPASVDNASSSKHKRALRARAHALRPVVWISQSGITPGALREVDRALHAHELIKIHADIDDRHARAELLAALSTELAAQAVQMIGKMLILFRARPETPQEPAPKAKPGPDRRRPPRRNGKGGARRALKRT